jgi:hypothetical protein
MVPAPPEPLNKKNVERLDELSSPFHIILSLLKKTGMKHNEAKLWAANYEYPQVADDIMKQIGHMLRSNRPKKDNSNREK